SSEIAQYAEFDSERQSSSFGKKPRYHAPAAHDSKVAPDGSRGRLLSPLFASSGRVRGGAERVRKGARRAQGCSSYNRTGRTGTRWRPAASRCIHEAPSEYRD